jgi:N-acetyl-1-D-myo-inositol-2-amino-2-deoxy-alpha-D-glucopyranoside deacetylase
MPGLLAFHAHPDDECSSTGGTLHTYVDRGEQVVVITATDGAEGEIHNYEDPESLKPRLAEMRREEMAAAMSILGVEHHEFLGYRDSGMMGEPSNAHPDAFWNADFMEATEKLVRLIRTYTPEVMTIYDPFGGYGHPDHINVHRIGMAAYTGAPDLSRFPLQGDETDWQPQKLYWTTWPRSRARAFADFRLEAGMIDEEDHARMQHAGTPDEHISAFIDVSDVIDVKEKALRAHRTQIPEDWFLLNIPEEMKPQLLGRESFVKVFDRVGAPAQETDLFTGLR